MDGQRSKARLSRASKAACIVAVLAGGLLPSAGALGQRSSSAGTTDGSDGTRYDAAPVDIVAVPGDGVASFVPPAATGSLRSLPKLSDIQVTYHGFGPKSQAAFEYATHVWEQMVRSPVPIKIDAEWTSLGTNVLGSASPTALFANFNGAPKGNTAYAAALANARAGRDLDPSRPEIHARFSSDAAWYTGTDGAAPRGQYDLVTVVMHEIAHGLGIYGSFDRTGSVGLVGSPPTAWDRFVADGSNTPLINFSGATLGSKLTSNAVRFTGAQAVAANGGKPVRLYAPATWSRSSSISHLDDSTYPSGSVDSLMIHGLADGDAIHDPGNIALGALRDMGWTTTTSRYIKPGAPTITRVSAGDKKISVYWSPAGGSRAPVSNYIIEAFEGGSTTPDRIATRSGTSTSFTFTELTNGSSFKFRAHATNPVGAGPNSSMSLEARPIDLGPFTDVDAFVLRQYADIFHKSPSSGSLESRRASINNGSVTPGRMITQLMEDPIHTGSVPPTIRLYLAYFKRLPDEGGLAYWAAKARAGTSLHKASDQFAASSEFTRTYGKLSNTAFVKLAYQNVLGRTPDAGGLSYWVGKLAKGYSRGSFMITVSESSENVRKTTNTVNVVALDHVMLAKVPAPSAVDADVARLVSGTPLNSLATDILRSAAYAVRLGKPVPPAVSFDRPVQVTSVTRPVTVTTADLNADGRQDIITLAATPGSTDLLEHPQVAVLLGGPTGLGAPVFTDIGYGENKALATGDVDHDGDLDVVVGPVMMYLPGSPSGALGAPVPLPGGSGADVAAVAVGDLTNDGLVDIVGPGYDEQTLAVWRQLATGGFAAPVSYPGYPNSVIGLRIADLDGDGRNDLASLSTAELYYPDVVPTHVGVYRQLPNGTLGGETVSFLGTQRYDYSGGFAVADVTGDGTPDITVGAVVNQQAHIAVLANNGAGTFTAQTPISLSTETADLLATDLNGDGRQDVIAISASSATISLLQRSTGGLAAPETELLEPSNLEYFGPGTIALLDLNGDGKQDLVTVSDNEWGRMYTHQRR